MRLSISNLILAFWLCSSLSVSCQETPPSQATEAPAVGQDTLIEEDAVVIPRPPEARKQWAADSVAPFTWEKLEAGLDLAIAEARIHTNIGDNRLYILRVDPAYFTFELVSAKTEDANPQTAAEWAEKHDLVAAINAGMYQMDHLTNVGYMKDHGKLNSGKLTNDNAMVAFHPEGKGLAPFRILDRACDDWDSLMNRYGSLSQGIRMVKCERTNVWSRQKKYWSTAAMGVDKQGRALFLFARTPYAVHDFIAMMLELPIGLQRCMYLEGGPEASFILRHPKKNLTRMGSFETGFWEDDSNDRLWPIPNVIGVKRK